MSVLLFWAYRDLSYYFPEIVAAYSLKMSYLPISRSSKSFRLWLPIELIEKIILEAWTSPLSTNERIRMFTSCCLVNRSWLSTFIRIAFIDVHIFSSKSSNHYLHLLRERAEFESNNDYLLPEASTMANHLCRSIIFHIETRTRGDLKPSEAQPAVTLYSDSSHSADAISNLLYMIDTLNYVPNLRRVTLEYVDWGFDDVFDQCRLLTLPPQVSRLELNYRFSDNLKSVGRSLSERYRRQPCCRWTTPNVKTLTISGAPMTFLSSMVETCPNLEVLEVPEVHQLHGSTQLPRRVRALSSPNIGDEDLPSRRRKEEERKAALKNWSRLSRAMTDSRLLKRREEKDMLNLSQFCARRGVRCINILSV